MHKVIETVINFRVALKIVSQAYLGIAVKIVIAQRRIDANVLLAPDGSLTVIDLPVIRIISVISDVAAEGNKVRMRVGNALHQLAAHLRIGCLGVHWISKSRISIGDKVDMVVLAQLDICRRSLRRKANPQQGHEQENKMFLRIKHGPHLTTAL